MNQIVSPNLIEPSFADAIARIAGDASLSPSKRAQQTCSLRRVAEALGKPLDAVPARWVAIRQDVARLHHAPLGVEAKTLANHIANVKAALAHMSDAAGVSKRAVPLSVSWSALAETIGAGLERRTLLAFMRFCSALGIEPEAVDEAVVDTFLTYRANHTSLKIGRATRRALARSWNSCVTGISGWPKSMLVEPPIPAGGLRSEDLPAGLRRDIENHLAHLETVRRDRRGKRLRPCKPGTIRTRRAELMAYVGKVVECGMELESLTSLVAALRADVVEKVIDAYWEKNGETPRVYTIDLAWKLLNLARESGVDAVELERLNEIRERLDECRQPGLTEKNRAVIRQVLTPDVWRSVLEVPSRLMDEAERRHNRAPIRAAVIASTAVAIQILVFAPIRVGNLAAIRLGENLIRPAGPKSPYWIVFPDYDVKNRVPLEFELNDKTTDLIDRYLKIFRPALLRTADNLSLFPGLADDHKGPVTLSMQITARVFKATGLRLTAHQFRHAAAAVFLRHRRGEYELVRRLLGHRSITTTMTFYTGLESIDATRTFSTVIETELKQRSPVDQQRNGQHARRRNRRG